MRPVSAWGRLDAVLHDTHPLSEPAQAQKLVTQPGTPGLAHGMGRSYGDVCLNPEGRLWLTIGLDHFIAFDETHGRITCEAGTLLRDIQQLAVPRGWMLPVTPGTQLITVGGAIANDVHGKNHHVHGTFGQHVRALRLQRTDGETIDCGPQQRSDWFAATVGGLGLTGVIVQAELQLRRVAGPWLNTETHPYSGINNFLHWSDSSEADWEHTVSWIDCLSGSSGRGLFMRGNHTDATQTPPADKQPLTMPLVPPVSLVNRLSLRPFNTVYYQLKKRTANPAISHYQPFFYPLDNLLEWNRMYGPKGFYQYQCVVPHTHGKASIEAMLDTITRAGEGSFLAVLKTFGQPRSPGLLSFPMPGITLALDFPNRGERTHRLFASLDAIVREAGGRLYPAKDARMPRDLFERGYPQLNEFLKYRDPGISSGFSRRTMGN